MTDRLDAGPRLPFPVARALLVHKISAMYSRLWSKIGGPITT